MREHGGTIVPESVPGEYAQFTVRIPAKAAPALNGTGHGPDERRENG